MRTEQAPVEPYAAYPIADETRILSDREGPTWLTLGGKKKISTLAVRHAEIVVERLASLFGELKPHRPASFLLAHRCAIHGVSVRGNVLDFESDDIATAQLAIDGEIEQRQIALTVRHLKLGAD